jgi:ATP-binding cassette subfamily C (CFTR/MRP) protein 1
MLELDSGSIAIDGVDISTVPRQDLRLRLNTLPQSSFFLPGSVRENMDPSNMATNQQIEHALREVQMWDTVEASGGLDADMREEILSHGQRQMFCLARAMIKPRAILIVDEATSGVDSDTDDIMQRVIRKAFASHTIIAIAHKLDTVLDFDRIVLLDKGRVIETGKPRELLAMPDSSFRALYQSLDNTTE